MIDTGNFDLESAKYKQEQPIEVDGNKTSLIVRVIFNHLDGTGRIEDRLSTKTVSTSDSQNAAVDQLRNRMVSEGRTLLLALQYEHKVNSGEINPRQTTLELRTPKERYEASADAAMAEDGITYNEERQRYENEDGTPWNNSGESDGGTGAERNPQLSLTDPPPKEAKRPRKSNAAPVEL